MRFNCPFHTRHPPIKLHLHPLVCIFELFQSRKYSTLIWECHSSVSQPTAALERALVGNRSSVLSGQVATSVRLCGRLRDRTLHSKASLLSLRASTWCSGCVVFSCSMHRTFM
eukprot:EG_transcript_37138